MKIVNNIVTVFIKDGVWHARNHKGYSDQFNDEGEMLDYYGEYQWIMNFKELIETSPGTTRYYFYKSME